MKLVISSRICRENSLALEVGMDCNVHALDMEAIAHNAAHGDELSLAPDRHRVEGSFRHSLQVHATSVRIEFRGRGM